MYPAALYKYREFNDYSLRLLSHNEVFFAAPQNLNDPLDCALPVRYDVGTIQQMYDKNLKNLKELSPSMDREERKILAMRMAETFYTNRDDERRREAYYQAIKEDINKDYGVLSLSSCNDSFLMWSHYCAGHQGFCVGFNTALLFDFRDTLIYRGIPTLFKKVDYYEPLPILNPFEMTDEELSITLLFSKAQSWSYEQEYRLIRGTYAGIGPNSLLELRSDIIESVILGMKCSSENREKIKEILRNRGDQISLYQAKQVFGSSAITVEVISD